MTTGENAAYTFKAADFGFTDPNDSPSNSLLAVQFTLLPTSRAGIITDKGLALTVNQFVSAADISAGKLVFTPATNLLSGNLAFFLCKFRVEDNGGTQFGGVNLDTTDRVLDVKIVPVNHAPVGTSGTVTTGENAAYKFKAADFGFTDPNDNPPNSLLAVQFTLLPTSRTGTLTDNGFALAVNQFVSAADINAGKLVFTPATNLLTGNLAYFLSKFRVADNGGTANGGVNLDQTDRVLDVKIVPVNHAPVGTSGTVTAAKNKSYTLKTSDFGFTDPNDSPPNTLLAVQFTTLPTIGTLFDNGIAVTANQFVSAADINSGKLVLVPIANIPASGPYFLCKFKVEDNGGTTNGGVNIDSTARVLYIKFTA